ncbi:MAG: DM13 domain-containing protein [Bryobacteraceae bacterium]
MTSPIGTWLSHKKWILIAVGVPVLVAAWWAFRPEKLWINEKVNEPAPFVSAAEPQPLFTGRFEGRAHQTSGRATIYKSPNGKLYLRLTDFTTSNGPDVHIVLARSDDKGLEQEIVKGDLDDVELGPLKGNKGDQNYDLPASTDLNKRAVVVYCERFHAVFGLAGLEPF